jgi:microcompartment protein CcmK/EutM
VKIARVVGNIVSSDKLPAFNSRKLMLVQPLNPDGSKAGKETMAIDYVGAGPGDIVLMGAAPGLAELVFQLERAPINELIMAIIDTVTLGDKTTIGNSVG